MIIHCRGGDTEIKRLTREVAEFCASSLMSKRLANSVEVWFHFKHIEGINYGDCIWEDDDYRPRLFTMDIHWDKDPTKRDYGKVLKTVCHEMVHVSQYAKGRLALNGKMEYKTQEEYENIWYEKEAYEMEKILAKSFFQKMFDK